MAKQSEFPTKASPIWADLLAWLDSEDTNNQTKNKSFSITNIGNTVFAERTTDNLNEGSANLYYTDARVSANATVTGKQETSNISNDIQTDTGSTTKYPSVDAVETYVTDNLPDIQKWSDAEVDTATDTSKYAALNQLLAYYWDVTPGDTFTYLEANTERSTSSSSPVVLKQFTINKTWCFKINFETRTSGGWNSEVQIYKNWVAYWKLFIESSTSYVAKTENLIFCTKDVVTLNVSQSWWTVAYIRNFNFKYDLENWVPSWIINTD